MPRNGDTLRVGITVFAALAVLAIAVLMVGGQNFLFTPTQSYFVSFRTVGGLAEDSPVQLNGVNVGKVDRIVLSENISEELLQVWIQVERRFAPRIREDSVARIKTLGLLGDKYVEITSGSPQSAEVPAGQEIRAAQPTDVDALIASGEDVAAYVVTTARSLSEILTRMERGEGLLGELVAEREGGEVTDSLIRTLQSIERVVQRVESGEGAAGRLLTDPELADKLTHSVDRLDHILADLETGPGLLPSLIRDPKTRDDFDRVLTRLDGTLADLELAVEELRSGNGLLPRLLNDEELAQRLTEELEQLLQRLNLAAEQVTEGEGTVSKLVNDPAIYEALKDIVVGIDESRFLRWLVRNRQKAGIKKRYEEAQKEAAAAAVPDG